VTIEATTTDTRAATIELYAGKAADLTRKAFTAGFAAADGLKAFFATPKASTVAVLGKAKVASKDLLAKAKAKVGPKNGVGETPASA
jgi:hypothetical protein